MTASSPAKPIRAVADAPAEDIPAQRNAAGPESAPSPAEDIPAEGTARARLKDQTQAARLEARAAKQARKAARALAQAETAAPDPDQDQDQDTAPPIDAGTGEERQALRGTRPEKRAKKAERELAQAEAEARKQEAIRNAALPVRPARVRRRHYAIFTSFLFCVLLPASLTGWYLWERATDQYASYVGFSVRTEEQGSSFEGLFGISELSGSSSTDTDILYEFLQSQQLVAAVDAQLDLREIWSRPGKAKDPIFAYAPPGTIEDLTAHWGKKVKIYYESTTGLIDLRVLAFDPADAQAIAKVIYDNSSDMINDLSAIAREDAISYARDELEQTKAALKQARLDLQTFRNRTQIIDPALQGQTQSGLIGALESELANAQIDMQLLRDTARPNDPRIAQTRLRISAIEKQIAAERSELGLQDENSTASVADLVGQYEALAVDLQFAQEAYTGARATYDAARNEARRKSRYLAAHVPPTLAEQSEYPKRRSTMIVVSLFLFLGWAFLVLAAYAMRDRR